MLISYYHHNDKESINSVVLINELIKYIWYICRLSTRHIKEKHFSSAITCIEDNISLISVYIHHKQNQKKKSKQNKPNKQNQTKRFTCCTQLVFSWSWVWIMSALSQLNYYYKHYPSMCTLYELERKSVLTPFSLHTKHLWIHFIYLQFYIILIKCILSIVWASHNTCLLKPKTKHPTTTQTGPDTFKY